MKIRRRFVLIGLAAIVVFGVGAAVFEFTVLRGVTPNIDTSGSISSLEKHEIGGVEQWILVRGHDRTAPVVLFLHGGPGTPVMYLAHAFQRALEHDYVVVHWDRRGAGKSFDALSQMPALSVSQTLEDTYELTRTLLAIPGAATWGCWPSRDIRSTTRPSLEPGNWPEPMTRFRRCAASSCTRLRKRPAMPHSRLEPRIDPQRSPRTICSFWPLLKAGSAAPEYTLRDVLNVKNGADLVGRAMKYDVVPKPSDGENRKVDVPVFFFLGRHDFNTPSRLAKQYLERLDAPLKRLAWFEKSAHFPFFEEPDRFHRELLQATQAAAEFWRKESSRKGAVPPVAAEIAARDNGHR